MEKATIICVDDERIVLTSLKAQLRREFGNDFYIETAESGEEAVEIIEDLVEDKVPIPVVISDQIMPGMKGDELLKHVSVNSQKTLTIMLTGQADANAVGNAVNNGNLYRFIAKPWDETDLNMTVKEALRSYFQEQKIIEQNGQLEELVKQLKGYNERLEELVDERTKEIVSQKEVIENKNEEITSGIRYARKIQKAILPAKEYFKEILNDYFIFYKPKDIVSGDFFWATTREDGEIVIVAADCTGHGVPGAIMSMLGVTLLNEIVKKSDITQSNEILNQLRNKVIKSLHQNNYKGIDVTHDGMDLALLKINHKKMKLQFSGAYNPLILIRNGKLITHKADRMPIGVYKYSDRSFTNTDIDLKKGDVLYIFSDGYADQFGGEKHKKFMIRNFKDLLLKIHTETMEKQKEILKETFKNWKGNTEQIDDILVMGIKI